MKILLLATTLLLASLGTVSGQVKPDSTRESQTASATRARVLKNDVKPSRVPAKVQSLQAHAKVDNGAGKFRALASETAGVETPTTSNAGPSTTPRENTKAAPFTMASPISMASTQVYRVGPLDVLDIQLVGNPSRQSTLFTVHETGVLEYPLAGAPINVVGLTAAEIAGRLRQRIKIFENPEVAVSVRDFASHLVTVSGLVAAPGKKALRREAVPLYALLAEALVLPEAARATVTRNGRPPMAIDLKDSNHTATLITTGDVIKVSGAPPAPTEFFFIGGAINSPGQKPYHTGITLTQAIMASGGTSANAGERIKVSRLGNNGRLISQEYNLRRVQLGRAVDPVLQKGDRIEVFAAN
jgi:protein involved in polysaccharide export with SLBB domain